MIDWIELIPFAETRNYVQRVLEGYHVYKQRLANADVALVDYPGSHALRAPPLPMQRPTDSAAAFADTGTGTASVEPVHRPRFKPLDALPGSPVKLAIGSAADGKASSEAGAGTTKKTSDVKTFDDQENRRLAADDGEVIEMGNPSSEQTPKL